MMKISFLKSKSFKFYQNGQEKEKEKLLIKEFNNNFNRNANNYIEETFYRYKILIFLLLVVMIFIILFLINAHYELVLIFRISKLLVSTSLDLICKKFNLYTSINQINETSLINITLEDIFRDASDSPYFTTTIVPSNFSENDDKLKKIRIEKCTHFSCFDIYRCGLINYHPSNIMGSKTIVNKNISQSERIKIYIYPRYKFKFDNNADTNNDDDEFSNTHSLEFKRILRAIVTSLYYTNNPNEACLFIPNVDTLNFDKIDLEKLPQILLSLPYYQQMNSSNHLLFQMYHNKKIKGQKWLLSSNRRTDRTIIASGVFNDLSYRPNFDIATPIYSVFSQLYETDNSYDMLPFDESSVVNMKRKYTIISTQFDNIYSSEIRYFLLRLESIYSNRMVLFGFDCPKKPRKSSISINNLHTHNLPFLSKQAGKKILDLYARTYVCNNDRRMRKRYIDTLHDSEFCLIIKQVHYDNFPIISDALMSGCIPVIVDDNFVYPFEERIDWPSISIRIREYFFNNLIEIIDNVSIKRRKLMRINAVNIWNLYFRTIENISLTTLDIINDRVFSRPKNIHTVIGEDFYQLSPLSLDFFRKGFDYVSPKTMNLLSDGFTAVILTYNRFESLNRVVVSVSRVPSCQQILIIWNNQNEHPSSTEQWKSLPIPVQLILTKQNKLSNRFYPYASIENEAIFAIDDDITMLNPDEIEFAYQTWREFPDRIVGFPSRLHFWNNLTHSWNYDSEWKNKISLILTGAAFYHNYYNYLYTFVLPASIRDWVDEHMNCEDIAMNFLISNVTSKAPIKVTPRKKFKCSKCNKNNNYLSADVMRHLQLRSKCVDYFVKIFKYMPLKAVEFRSDPVLYRDSIPDKFKHFNLIGDL